MSMDYRSSPSSDWLRNMAAAEDEHASFSVGGLAADAGFLGTTREPRARATSTPTDRPPSRIAFARFVDLARRWKRLSLESLAEEADVELSELVEITEEYSQATPRTVYRLAHVLEVPDDRLMELAGLVEPREEVAEAAVRFAARSEPTVELSREEQDALEEFVKVLVEKSDAG